MSDYSMNSRQLREALEALADLAGEMTINPEDCLANHISLVSSLIFNA